MTWLRSSLSRISLATLLVMAMGSVAPAISNVLASQSPADAVADFGKGPLLVCSADGIKPILVNGSGGESNTGHLASKGHCPFCHLQTPVILGGDVFGTGLVPWSKPQPVDATRHHPLISRDGLYPPSQAPPLLTPPV